MAPVLRERREGRRAYRPILTYSRVTPTSLAEDHLELRAAPGTVDLMKSLLSGLLLLAACAGPDQAKLADTPTAHSRANTGLAPPASQSDRDRSELVDSMDGMDATQRAYREADSASKQAPPAPLPGQPATAPKKAHKPDAKNEPSAPPASPAP